MFFQKEKKISYDKTGKKPVLHISICTGEKTAGFRDMETNHLEELMLIQNKRDLQEFMKQYNVLEEEIEKEW